MLLKYFFKSREPSIANQYMFYAVTTIIIVMLTTLWVSYVSYRAFIEEKDFLLRKETHELQFILDKEFSLVEHLLQFIGTTIKHNYDGSPHSIIRQIKPHENNFKDDFFPWNIVYFFTEDGYLISEKGASDEYKSTFKEIKPWVNKALHKHWYLQFSAPDVGIISGDYVLPCGIGIFDKAKNKFIGYLGLGISIEKLTTSFINHVGDNLSFIVYDDNRNLIFSSEPEIENDYPDLKNLPLNIGTKNTDDDAFNVAKLDNVVYGFDSFYQYYIHSKKFPFSILVGYNKHKYYSALKHDILPTLIVYILLGIIFASLLIILGYQVVKPILELGRAADGITQGKRVRISHYKVKELNLLSNQLNDISKNNRSLRYKQSRLAFMNGKLANANEFIKSNLSFLSHELTNPIANIIEFSKMLKKKTEVIKDPQTLEFIDIINMAAEHQNKQLNFFMKLFKFQKSKRKLQEKSIRLQEIINWNLSMIAHHIKNKNIRVITKVPTDLTLLGDEIMIGQLIQNLASNGSKYNKAGGELTIEASLNKNKEIEINFTDQGVGIEKRELKNIFKMFKRVKTGKEKIVGYGIGLAYAKECVDAHNGKIEVHSKLQEGTIFKVIFPKSRTVFE